MMAQQVSIRAPRAESTTRSIARQSVIWNAAFSLFRDVAQFAQAAILARLLLPEAYGQFQLVTSSIGFLAIFSSRSFVAHTLQVRDDADTHYQDHFTSGAVLQVGMFLIANIIAIGLRFQPTYAAVSLPIHAMSVTFLLEWPTEIRLKMLERALDWKRRRLLHAMGVVLGLILAVVMATLGCGVYSLLVPGMVVTLPFMYDLFVYAQWRPTWEWSWKNYRDAFHFGLTRLGAGMSAQGRQLLEHSVLSATLGFASLGLVNRAVGLSQLACGKIASQLMYAIYPILTRLEAKTGRAALAGDLVLRVVAWSAIPLACCVGLLGLPVISTVYGSQWLASADYLRWTMAWISVMALSQVANTLLLARQQARLCVAADLCGLIGTAICLYKVLPHGITEYYAGLTCVYSTLLLVLLVVLVRHSAITFWGLGRALVPPIICSTISVFIANFVIPFEVFDSAAFFPAAVWGISFFVLYVVALRLCFSEPLTELVSYFPIRDKIGRVLRLSF